MTPYYQDDRCTLYLGDCLEVMAQLAPGQVDCLITDPPYSSGGQFKGDRNMPTGTKYSSVNAGVELFAGDNRDQRSFAYWLTLCLVRAYPLLAPSAIVALFSDWRQLPSVSDSLQGAGLCWRGLGVWDKTEGSRPQMGTYRNQAEYIVWGSRGPMRERPRVVLPGVWRMACVAVKRRFHFTEKPLALMRELLRIATPHSTILDPFAGGGSTLVAAKAMGLRAIGVEMLEAHAQTTAERLAATAGGKT